MDTSTHDESSDEVTPVPRSEEETWLKLPTAPRIAPVVSSTIAFRSPRGRVIVVPAPIAVIGLVSLFGAAALSLFEPQAIHAASLDRQATALLRWEAGERRRVADALELLEPEVRELRRVALSGGIVPPKTVDCGEAGANHLARHLEEASWLTEALLDRTRSSAELDLLPSRSPIDLTAGWVASSTRAFPGVHVSSEMGTRSDPFTGKRRAHQGLDLSAPAGTPVVAPSTGVVEFAGAVDSGADHARALLGNHVLIRHGDSGYVTLYAHLESVDVKAGQKVKGGDRLGAVGSTGRSTAPHLHYQVMRGEGRARENLDPLYFITDSILIRDGHDVWYVPPRQASAGVLP